MQPYQQRVVDEAKELNIKCAALLAFGTTPFYKGLPEDDRNLLDRQYNVMREYADILAIRIKAF